MSNPQQGNNDTLTSTLSPISSENIRQNIDDAANGCGDNNNIKYECSICYESIKPPKLFGILSNCDHVFCFDCINEWRSQKNLQLQQQATSTFVNAPYILTSLPPPQPFMKISMLLVHRNLHSKNLDKYTHNQCPICRKFSSYFIPAEQYVIGDDKIELCNSRWTTMLSTTCPFSDGDYRRCPYKLDCFYCHFDTQETTIGTKPTFATKNKYMYKHTISNTNIQSTSLSSKPTKNNDLESNLEVKTSYINISTPGDNNTIYLVINGANTPINIDNISRRINEFMTSHTISKETCNIAKRFIASRSYTARRKSLLNRRLYECSIKRDTIKTQR